MSIHGGDDGFLDRVGKFGPGFDEVDAVGICEVLCGHFFDVGACCEGFVGAGEDHGADGGVGVEGFHGRVEFEDEGGEEGVEGFRPVDFDLGDMSANCQLVVGLCHSLPRPTPFLGVETLMCSNVFSVMLEYVLVLNGIMNRPN